MKLTRRFAIFMGLAPILIFTAHAAARAGGGEGYHGGGGGGGGYGGGHGGGGSGGGGQLVFDLVWFCVVHPAIGLPLLIILVVLFFYFRGSELGTSQLMLPPTIARDAPVGDPIGVVRSHDLDFDPDAFCNRVGSGFIKLQAAWCNQDLKDVRPFISDGIHERFLLQFAEQKSDGYRDRMDNVGIDRIFIAAANSGAIYDELSVKIQAHAADYKISLRDGRPIERAHPVQPFAEVWSFLRRRGSATVPGKPGLLEGNCPNCGAPIALNESANCANCNALLRSGQYDWVLSEITQESEWRGGTSNVVPGLSQLQQRDPDLNVQSLEDRASVMFWRKAAADRNGKIDPLFKMTSPTYIQIYVNRLKTLSDQSRIYFAQCAVGAVDVLKFIPANAQPHDLALVEIHWSGVKVAVQPDRTVKPVEENTSHKTLFVLMRNASTKTDIAKGIASAHCPSCGAPESGGTSGACEFCGTALNDGSTGWVLNNILSLSDPQAQQLLRQPTLT